MPTNTTGGLTGRRLLERRLSGMIGKGNSGLRDLPEGGYWIGIIRKLAGH
jgi:hypothetical protein